MSLRLGVLLLITLALGSAVVAQGPAVDPIRELLVEVRALRVAMERSTTLGARIQLLVARVQLQEQRIAELSRRINGLRAELQTAEDTVTRHAGAIKRVEEEVNSGTVPEKDRKQYAFELEMLRSQADMAERRRQQLTTEVNFLVSQVSADQARWSDFNSQLDELERSLIQASKPR